MLSTFCIHAGLLDGCYSKFDDPDDIIPLTKVGGVKVAEMWHGPTGAFKDIALSIVGRLVDFTVQKSGRKANHSEHLRRYWKCRYPQCSRIEEYQYHGLVSTGTSESCARATNDDGRCSKCQSVFS